MRASLRWLRDYATLDAPVAELATHLVETGTAVERIDRGLDGIVVARVVALTPVPESTRGVLLAHVDAGVLGTPQVVTGAGNLDVGDLVPWAPPGTVLPGRDEPLSVRSMFGGRHHSAGMLCSAAELGVGDDASGILVLEHGTPGQPLHEVLPLDSVLELDITTNRPDCLCHVGIARELAAALREPLREPRADIPEALMSAASAQERVSLDIGAPGGCPRFAVRLIESVAVGPSPEWMRRRLEAVGVRPINNVVDVTNYVLHELGQPLHAFDLDRFAREGGDDGRRVRVAVRRAHPGERLLCLDDVDRELGGADIVVCSGDRAVSLAGIMGGRTTAVDERTRSVLLEAAAWDGPAIRATSRRLGLRSDASTLFEKGLSDTLPGPALERAAALIAELGGGHVLRDVIEQWPAPLPPIEPISTSGAFIGSRLGYHVDVSEAATALARLGFAVEQEGDGLRALPPHFRRDVTIAEDVVEEVGRTFGYGRLPSTLPGRRGPVRGLAPDEPLDERVRDVLVGAGFDELITYSFVAPPAARALPGLGGGRTPLPLLNPLRSHGSVLRTSLLPGVCQALAANLDQGVGEAAVFELGRAFWEGERRGQPPGSTPDGADAELPPLPAEPLLLALAALCAEDDPDEGARRLRRLQSAVAWLTEELSGAPASVSTAEPPGMRPGRGATVEARGERIGLLGELTPDVLASLGLRGRVAVAELRLDTLAAGPPRPPRYRPPPRFPAVVQDLAVTVPASSRAGEAIAVIREAGGLLLESCELYDEYRDPRFGDDRKGWTFRLTYRAPDRTLTGEEAQACQEAIVLGLTQRCGAAVRG